MDGFQTYQTYLSLKLHFSKENYDFFKFNGKSRSKPESFEKRKDKYFFKKISSKFDDTTIIEYFVSLFVNDKTFWIGNILDKDSDEIYKQWKRKTQSLFYTFEQDIDKLISKYNKIDNWFKVVNTHPPIIKEYLASNINLETVVILNQLLNFVKDLDKAISDPVIWPDMKRKILKYSPFLTIDRSKYKQLILRKIKV
jgi:hypothetical protein